MKFLTGIVCIASIIGAGSVLADESRDNLKSEETAQMNTEKEAVSEKLLTDSRMEIAVISAYTAAGDMKNLESAIIQGLSDELTVNEVKEVLVQMYAYCGFPKSLNALNVLMDVAKAGNYREGSMGVTLESSARKIYIGDRKQIELTGSKVEGPLFDFAPAIDIFLKEHLFADIFSRGVLSDLDREVATIAALSAVDGLEPQLNAHINIGKRLGLSDADILKIRQTASKAKMSEFGIGEPNDAYAKYFTGRSYLKTINSNGVFTANVTFEPGVRNNWHIHHKGGQILIVTGGRGYYQEWGKDPVVLKKGDSVTVAPGVKHWHGAAPDSWFSHIAVEIPAEGSSNEWLEPVSDKDYSKLK